MAEVLLHNDDSRPSLVPVRNASFDRQPERRRPCDPGSLTPGLPWKLVTIVVSSSHLGDQELEDEELKQPVPIVAEPALQKAHSRDGGNK